MAEFEEEIEEMRTQAVRGLWRPSSATRTGQDAQGRESGGVGGGAPNADSAESYGSLLPPVVAPELTADIAADASPRRCRCLVHGMPVAASGRGRRWRRTWVGRPPCRCFCWRFGEGVESAKWRTEKVEGEAVTSRSGGWCEEALEEEVWEAPDPAKRRAIIDEAGDAEIEEAEDAMRGKKMMRRSRRGAGRREERCTTEVGRKRTTYGRLRNERFFLDRRDSHMGNDRAIYLALAINTRCRFLPCWLSKIVAFSVRVTKDKKT